MINFADLFCGAGGATTGVLLAAKRAHLGIRDGVAINHWPIAVETHTANHPNVRHLCENIASVDPCVAVPGGKLDLLWASPECTHHSRARCGKPRQNQSRSGASHILTWLDKLYVRNVIIENVPEFADWGPLTTNGQPIKRKRGASFNAFIESIKARNYNVEWRVLNAADYGDATTRRRLFIIARRKPLPILWPEPTHRPADDLVWLSGKKKLWRPARDIIDWTDLGTALSQRVRPLKPNTMRRIFAGLEKFCGLSFIVPTNFGERTGQTPRVNSVDAPLGTVTSADNFAFVMPRFGEHKGKQPRKPHSVDDPLHTVTGEGGGYLVNMKGKSNAASVNQPMPTQTAHAQHLCLATPFLIGTDNTKGHGKYIRSVDQPTPTAVTKQNCGLVTSFILPNEGIHKGNVARSIEQPLPTATAGHGAGFLVSLAHGNETKKDNRRRAITADKPLPTQPTTNNFGVCQHRIKSTDKPLPTIAGNRGEYALIRPFLIKLRGTQPSHVNATHSVDQPVDTISCSGKHHALIQPFIAKYFGSDICVSVDDPLDTISTRDRFLLVNPIPSPAGLSGRSQAKAEAGKGRGEGRRVTYEARELEIYFRLLKPSELAGAHSFPRRYKFAGNKTAIVKQIGNSNPVELTAALTAAVL